MPTILFYVNGAPADSRVRWPSVTLQDVLGAQPNTGTLTFDTVAPHVGDAIAIGLGSMAPADLLFGGEIQNLEATYQADARNLGLREWPVDLIDHSFALNKRRPFVSFVNESATTAAQQLVATYAPGFTSAHVQAGLPTLTINFDGSQTLLECLNAIAQAIGGRTKVDYSRDVHLFLPPEPGLVMPDPITLDNPPLNSPPIRFTVDLSQCRTRVYGKGHGETIPSDISIGETILPVESIAFFNAAGGRAIASLTSDGAQTQQLTYAGIQVGGVGTVVGPGAAPSAQPTATPVPGSGLLNASYYYAYTWITAAGETLPSPIAIVFCGPLADPTSHPTLNPPVSGTGPNAGLHYYGVSFVAGSGETLALTSTNNVTTVEVSAPTSYGITGYPTYAYNQSSDFIGMTMRYACTVVLPDGTESGMNAMSAGDTILSGGSGMIGLSARVVTEPLPVGAAGFRIYASRNGGSSWHVCNLYAGGTQTAGSVVTPYLWENLSRFDAAPGLPAPSGTISRRTVPLTTVPIGPPGTTARRIYRTAANAAYAPGNFKLAATISDNVTTSWNDTVPDSSLTGALPASNTSALNQMQLSAIAVGPTAVTSRKVYRTAAYLATLKLLATIANNTATTYGPDTASDASLGALPPTIDTSGLTQPVGQVVPGATSIPTAGASPFLSTGGWVQSSTQVIRYTGVTANALTGIPASGPGAITSSIQYNAPIVAVPALTGVTGIVRGLLKGASVHLFVQLDDTTAQAALGQLERNPDGSPTDGVREYLISDERRGEASLRDVCAADLDTFAQPIVQVVYHCRDPKTRAGSTVNVAIADGCFNPDVFNPAVFNTGHHLFGYSGEFLIQSVTVTFDPAPQLLPRYAVTASSSKFTFMDLLQRVLIAS